MEKALAAVRQLVEDFKAQENYYLSGGYQESQVRQDFIDKFFAAPGWDVTHTRQKNPYRPDISATRQLKQYNHGNRNGYQEAFSGE